jgi:hypothetical protein
MGLPAKQKTWTITANNRSTFVTVESVCKDVLFGIKQHLKTMTGVTVKGSSDGTTAAMDGVDRWTTAAAISNSVANTTTAGGSWIVLTSSVLGAEIAISHIGGASFARITFSVGGYSLAGTPTFHPTTAANDEMFMKIGLSAVTTTGSDFVNAAATLDRLWSCGKATDGSAWWFTVVRSNVLLDFGFMQKVTSAIVAPATFSPNTIGFDSVSSGNPLLTQTLMYNFAAAGANLGPVARANNGIGGGNVSLNQCTFAIEGFSNTNPATITDKYLFAPELQGGGFLMATIGAHSFAGTTRGKLGNVIDIWAALQTATLGDTYPNDATRQFLALGGLAGITLPWDGSAFVGA